MKGSRNVIAMLVGLCVLMAMIAFFLPDRSGMVLSYLTISLAALVGALCVGGMIRLFSREKKRVIVQCGRQRKLSPTTIIYNSRPE